MPGLSRVASALLAAAGLVAPAQAFARPAVHAFARAAGRQAPALTPFERAEREKEALEGRAEQQRTRRDYEHVLDAYRAIYHTDPASPKADASVYAVAELLAEEGRVFEDNKLLTNAIGQYEFLRREYPGSHYRFSALFTEAEIYRRDLGQRATAQSIFQQFLKQYPNASLADQARQELAEMHAEDAHAHHGKAGSRAAIADSGEGAAATGVPASSGAATAGTTRPSAQRRNTVLTAALQSQQEEQARQRGSSAAANASSTAQLTAPPTQTPARGNANAQSGAPAPMREMEPAPRTDLTDAQMTAPPPVRSGRAPLVTGIRHWSTPVYTRVAIDLQGEVQYEASRVPNPDRIFFDLHGARLAPELIGKSVEVTDGGFLKRVRAAQFSNDVTRIVLDVSDVSEYSAFLLPDPSRLIIDIHGIRPGSRPPMQVAAVPQAQAAATRTYSQNGSASPNGYAGANPQSSKSRTPEAGIVGQSPSQSASRQSRSSLNEADIPPAPYVPPASSSSSSPSAPSTNSSVYADSRYVGQTAGPAPIRKTYSAPATQQSRPQPVNRPTAPAYTATNRQGAQSLGTASRSSTHSPNTSLQDIASLDRQPDRVQATSRPTTAPIAASVAGTTPAPQPDDTVAVNTPPPLPTRRSHASTSTVSPAPAAPATGGSADNGVHEATPTSAGQRSLVRALGLKIGRIVVDAGHGGHDSGTLGPQGIQEKDVVLDVSLRLGKLLKQRLGADVIYTRDDDTFIPLETRTAIANKAQADLFISVHANSSSDSSARGVETYYLNFTSSPDSLEVAARENAVSNQSIHQLSDLVKKIALTEKINESHEFASDVQSDLYAGLEKGNSGLKDRGVKKAPFVVLIGANMPSILAEISFLTNPDDAHELRDPNYRERIAESLYRGVAKYVGGLSGVRVAQTTGD